MQKKTSVAGEWAKKGEDILNGDVIEILNAGEMVTGEFGERNVFHINTRNGERLLTLNQTSVNNLVDAFGEDSESWVGKKSVCFLVNVMVGGKMVKAIYLAAEGWDMLDDGSFAKRNNTASVQQQGNQPAKEQPEGVQTNKDVEEIKIEDIPF